MAPIRILTVVVLVLAGVAACADGGQGRQPVAPRVALRGGKATNHSIQSADQIEDLLAADDWKGVDADGCRTPLTTEACRTVKEFLGHHSRGDLADDARAILKASRTPGGTWCVIPDRQRYRLAPCTVSSEDAHALTQCRRWHCTSGCTRTTLDDDDGVGCPGANARLTPWEDDHPLGPDDCDDVSIPVQLAPTECGER